jgi:hypothetical protein
MKPRFLPVLVGVMLVSGCATPSQPQFGNNHPASPQAAEGAVIPPSTTLAANDPAAPASGGMPMDRTDGTPMKSGGPMDHEHMLHADKHNDDVKPDVGGMKHDGHTVPAMPAENGSPAMRPAAASQRVTAYSCVMHPEVMADAPGKCPKCGMKLMPKR